jgi:hypothetical protein
MMGRAAFPFKQNVLSLVGGKGMADSVLGDDDLAAVFGPAAKRACGAGRVGVRRGEQSFRVDPIVALTEQEGIPAETGEWPAAVGDAGGRYGPEYRSDADLRRDALERNPDHQFFTLVAGFANTEVYRLYDADDLDRKVAMLREEQETRAAAAEVQISVDQLSEQIRNTRERLQAIEERVFATRQRLQSDTIFTIAQRHERDAGAYRTQRRLTDRALDWWDFLTLCGRPMFDAETEDALDLFRRIAADLGEETQVTNLRAVEAGAVLAPGVDIGSPEAVGDPSDVVKILLRSYDALAGQDTMAARRVASARLRDARVALCRYLAILLIEWRGVDDAAAILRRDAADDLVDPVLAGTELDAALRSVVLRGGVAAAAAAAAPREGLVDRFVALRFVQEAGALAQFLSTAQTAATIATPLARPPTGVDADPANRSIMDLPGDLLGMWLRGATEAARATTRAVETFGAVSSEEALRRAGLLNSAFVREGGRVFWDGGGSPPPAATPAYWPDAVAPFERVGGRFLKDLDAQLPLNRTERKTARGGTPIPAWSPDGGAPSPYYSQKMRVLYEQYGAEWRRVKQQLVASGGALAPRDAVLYGTLTGQAAATPEDVVARQEVTSDVGPLLVFSTRVYRADLRLAIFDGDEAAAVVRADLVALGDRMRRMARGEPVRRSVPEAPYRHRPGWVERPENRGVVRLSAIAVAGLAAAWDIVKAHTPFGDMPGVDAEFMQRNQDVRTDFAQLVALKLAVPAQIFPRQYRSNELANLIAVREQNVVERLRTRYEGASARTVRPRGPDAEVFVL